jgi:hypothetical protein
VLQTSYGLSKCGASGFPIRFIELGHFHPTYERHGGNARRLRGLLDVPMDKQIEDRFFLLTREF